MLRIGSRAFESCVCECAHVCLDCAHHSDDYFLCLGFPPHSSAISSRQQHTPTDAHGGRRFFPKHTQTLVTSIHQLFFFFSVFMRFDCAPDRVLIAWHHLPGFLFLTRAIYSCRVAALHCCETELSCNCYGLAERLKAHRVRGKIDGELFTWIIQVEKSPDEFGNLLESSGCRLHDSTRPHTHFHMTSYIKLPPNLHQIWGCGIYTIVLSTNFFFTKNEAT